MRCSEDAQSNIPGMAWSTSEVQGDKECKRTAGIQQQLEERSILVELYSFNVQDIGLTLTPVHGKYIILKK